MSLGVRFLLLFMGYGGIVMGVIILSKALGIKLDYHQLLEVISGILFIIAGGEAIHASLHPSRCD